MTKDHLLKTRLDESKIFSYILKICLKRFNKYDYKKLFRQKHFISLIKVLKESEIIQKMIDENPKLKVSEQRYLEAVDSIISFKETNSLNE